MLKRSLVYYGIFTNSISHYRLNILKYYFLKTTGDINRINLYKTNYDRYYLEQNLKNALLVIKEFQRYI